MPRFRQVGEMLTLMDKKECIRNVGVIAHIDHGKTTLIDSLLVEAGLLSPRTAGSARVLDYLEEEQKRGITIKNANISLLHSKNDRSFLINLVDTPGHVDFTGKVTRALRAIDSAVVVVDAVEEIMVQTEMVTRQALEERVRPMLFINKIDRLISELKLNADEIQKKLTRIINNFNNLIEIYGEPQFRAEWKVDPARETVAFGSALHRWGFTAAIAKRKGTRFSDIVDAYKTKAYESLQRTIPVQDAILDVVVKNSPSPVEAQKYRIAKIWRGNLNSKLGQAMLSCDDSGPTVMCITNVQADPNGELVTMGRLFSGSIKGGDRVHLINADKDCDVQEVSIYMGSFREKVNQITAGNIAALLGLKSAKAGETLIDASQEEEAVPFEGIQYVTEPVLTVTIEPKDPKDLSRLLKAMEELSMEDPNLVTMIDRETGEYLLSGMGELHLEIALKSLKNYAGVEEINASPPMVTYRESISRRGKIVTSRSPNKLNKFVASVEPIEKNLAESINKGALSRGEGNILAVDEHRNVMINLARNIHHFQETKGFIISGFRYACRAGPLCGEPLRNVRVTLIEANIHDDPEQRKPYEIMRGVGKAIFGSFLTAEPILLEPFYKIVISVSAEWAGECSRILTSKRGKISVFEQKGVSAMITGYIPVAETFGLSAELRSATSGRAFWQSVLDHWERAPESIAMEVIMQIRKRKGLPPKIPTAEKFIDETL
ncbi:MAG: GTP-binding protein [Candidatus Bathycorpusculaceae bacterium]